MAEHGGPRTPRNPAPVSGPGRLSKRTDGGPTQKVMVPTDQPYGDREALIGQEKSAGMSQSPSVTPAALPSPGGGAAGQQPVVPLDAPSTQPHVPVTNGVPIGAGAGVEALGGTPPGERPNGALTNMLAAMSATDTTGTLAKLYEMAKQRGV